MKVDVDFIKKGIVVVAVILFIGAAAIYAAWGKEFTAAPHLPDKDLKYMILVHRL